MQKLQPGPCRLASRQCPPGQAPEVDGTSTGVGTDGQVVSRAGSRSGIQWAACLQGPPLPQRRRGVVVEAHQGRFVVPAPCGGSRGAARGFPASRSVAMPPRGLGRSRRREWALPRRGLHWRVPRSGVPRARFRQGSLEPKGSAAGTSLKASLKTKVPALSSSAGGDNRSL